MTADMKLTVLAGFVVLFVYLDLTSGRVVDLLDRSEIGPTKSTVGRVQGRQAFADDDYYEEEEDDEEEEELQQSLLADNIAAGGHGGEGGGGGGGVFPDEGEEDDNEEDEGDDEEEEDDDDQGEQRFMEDKRFLKAVYDIL